MQISLLKEYVSGFLDQQAVKLVEMLYGKENVNEFLIAKKLNLTVNQTRNILYKLADEGLVNFIRKKDSKKGGWYTYFWTLDIEKSLIKLKEKLTKEKEEIEIKIKQLEQKRFFLCPSCSIESGEEDALTSDYHCSECGSLLNLKDASSDISNFEKRLSALNNNLEFVNAELKILEEKAAAVRAMKEKRDARKKKRERMKKKKEKSAGKKSKEKGKKKDNGKKKSKTDAKKEKSRRGFINRIALKFRKSSRRKK